MRFDNEDALQNFMSAALSKAGIENEREVWTADRSGRIDILTDKYAIEVKPVLSRSSIMQAAGQMLTYIDFFPGRQPVIAGMTPTDERSLQSAKQAAARIEKKGITIWWVDEIDLFVNAYSKPIQTQRKEREEEIVLPLFKLRWLPAITALTFLIGFCSQATPEPQVSYGVVDIPEGKELHIKGDRNTAIGVLNNGDRVVRLGKFDSTGYELIENDQGVVGWVPIEHLN